MISCPDFDLEENSYAQILNSLLLNNEQSIYRPSIRYLLYLVSVYSKYENLQMGFSLASSCDLCMCVCNWENFSLCFHLFFAWFMISNNPLELPTRAMAKN